MYSYLFVFICYAYVHMLCTYQYLILVHTQFKTTLLGLSRII